ncbi:ABC transporter permease [Segnochrobactrum spirostomi]|uniref:ABC transporter permease n=1 Tax=Segnochrobactrum spirostomi TaxID=2608987 RepID=A0A6A7XYG3_9HYPH|nr:ABC transporter permease [Segnochrobactrum spirostomi]MQT11443.1 ABC transporter permease [Segnochrobactrum spirostomi]
MSRVAVAAAGGRPLAVRLPSSPWLLVLPFLAVLAVFYVVPIGQVLWLSFSDPTLGFGNYARLASSESLQRVLLTTFRVCATTTFFAITLGYLIAYVMIHAGPTHRLWITGFVLVPFWISLLVRAFAWLTLLRSEGIINNALIGLGVIDQPLPLVYNEFAVVIGMVHYMVPYAVLPLYANMKGIDPRLADASRSLGAGAGRTFLSVTLPLSMPGIVAAGLLVFILTLGFFVTPAILGGGKVVMIAEYVSVQVLKTVRWGVGTMMASVLLATVVFLLIAMAKVVDVRQMFGAK